MKRPITYTLVSVLCLASFLLLNASGQPYEVRGSLESVYILPDGSAPQTNNRNFILATDGQDVSIRCGSGTRDQGIDYHEFGTDGTVGYQFVKFQTRTNTSGSRKASNDATMAIYPSSEPQTSVPTIRHIWRIYATQRGLRENKKSFIRPDEPVWLNGTRMDGDLLQILGESMQLRADWAFDDRPPYLLQSLIDYHDAAFDSKKYSTALIPDEFMTGYTNSRMDVVAWTNIAGLHLPTDTRVLTYRADTSNHGRLYLRSTHRILATNILARTSRTNFIPALTAATRIVDYRFAKGRKQAADYTSTNGIIQATFEEAWEEVYRRYEESRRRMEERERSKALELLPETISPK